MLKKMLLMMALGFSGSLLAAPIADTHTDMSGCESCHQDGTPSADYAFENEQCASCHGDMKSLEGDSHKKHDGVLTCTDCHTAHEEKDPAAGCKDCH